MDYTKSRDDTVNEYIDSLNPSIKKLFIPIRETILTIAPDLNESIKWKNCLVYATKKNLIQTVVGKEKVSLIFFDGARIHDKFQLLEGDGEKVRTLRVTSKSFPVPALQDYVRQALAL